MGPAVIGESFITCSFGPLLIGIPIVIVAAVFGTLAWAWNGLWGLLKGHRNRL